MVRPSPVPKTEATLTLALFFTPTIGCMEPYIGDGMWKSRSDPTASAVRWSGEWHVMQRQPWLSHRFVQNRPPRDERHQEPGGRLREKVGPG